MARKQKFNSFAEMVEQSETPILVDFYAHWCGPCKIMSSILETVKGEVGDELMVVKIDTDRYPQIAAQWQVEALPTVMLFNRGNAVDRIEGVVEPQQLLARVRDRLQATAN